ncbi:MAG: manganese oxidase [Acidobacteriaceae bacterium]|jgi:FtsP/CotA-like multicopper oxidase with cupredoxin domain|nr:manganese oxidase [Acidobacteriaceae bacterium]
MNSQRNNRRSFLQRALGLSAGLVAAPSLFADEATRLGPDSGSARPILELARSGSGNAHNIPVTAPDVADLPFTVDNGTKVFHLIAEPVKQSILPNKTLDLWGFNGSAPGPTIQVQQGDHVRVIFDNHLPEPTSVHWHGFEDQVRYDGQPGISQQPVRPGGRFVYEFHIYQSGTFFYHSHMSMQQMIGMLGGFIMHPAAPYQPAVDHDFLIHLQEYAVLPSSTIPNSMSMEYNWLVLNGKAGPAITPMIVPLGSRVRIRLVNLGMDHHPMHLHGHTFYITGTEGGRIPETAWWPGNTVLVGVAQSRDIEFVANNPGDWMLHCHLPHHNMNQMSSTVGRMTRTGAMAGMSSGVDMNTSMGMLEGTPPVPMGDDYGPSLGRGMGVASTSDMATTNGPLSEHAMHNAMSGMQMNPGEIAANANSVPNFPQDAYMEGSMMNMDAMVATPANAGLLPGWSAQMQGMMTLLRVLPQPDYDRMMQSIRNYKSDDKSKPNHSMPGMQMPGMDMKGGSR